MMTTRKKLSSSLASLLAGMLIASPVLADDTEIYLGENQGLSTALPNILFVIDNSGSMSTSVSTQSTYNPSVVYSGSCAADRVYYGTSTSSCGDYVNLASVQCKAALDAFATFGTYTDFVSRYNSGAWKSLTSTDKTSTVECKGDRGVHGNGGTGVYAANSSNGGPWIATTGTPSKEINWGSGTVANSKTLRSGNFRNWELSGGSTTKDRIDVVKEAVYSIIGGLNNANVALMRFDDDGGSPSTEENGGYVVYAMEDVKTAKTGFLTAMNALSAETYTPLSETMYEAAQYYRGGKVDFGAISEPAHSIATSRSATDTTKYKSPIQSQCQKNYIVYLTDGDPTMDTEVDATRRTNLGMTSNCSTYGSGGYQSNCLDDIAYTLASADQSSAYSDKQVVSTFTIGFGNDMSADAIKLLKSTAAVSKSASGVGEYHAANDTAQLVSVFNNILANIIDDSATFSSPSVSVNAFNRSTHRSEMYFSLFAPANGPHWDGNFKRYYLYTTTDNTTGVKVVEVQDTSYTNAVDASNGFFSKTARSWWTPDSSGWKQGQDDDAPDGDDAAQGGAASNLKASGRNVYTYMGTSTNLADSSNKLHETNAAITTAVPALTADVLKWARGLDVKDEDSDGDVAETRKVMGDPLHGEPALVNYGGTEADPDITAYVPTNDGYLHAISVKDGSEQFAFIPNELLSNLAIHYAADPAVAKTYGLDGSVTAWVNDVDKDGQIESGDHVYIFFGMRRGGNYYYALDVTDRNNPKLMWTIEGGTGDFTELSQTWSQPQFRKIRLGGVDRNVLVFAGGYDTDQDNATVRTADSIGRAIYMVDATDGKRLWWASSVTGADLNINEMDYSIPSNVAVADADGDGYADKMYVGDMGGQIFRFDIARGDSATASLASLIKGGRIADLAGNTATDNRRFYYPPSVAITKSQFTGNYELALAISSGYREHPLNVDTEDRIYMIKDLPVRSAPAAYTTITESDLFDTTSDVINLGTAAQIATAETLLKDASGWYIKLETKGEKGLSKVLIDSGIMYVTTYLPASSAAAGDTCTPAAGTGRLYAMSLSDGGGVENDINEDCSNGCSRIDETIRNDGIPSDPKMFRTPDEALCVGTECWSKTSGSQKERLYWFER
jgi:type IV pilus assembly protein PilY1